MELVQEASHRFRIDPHGPMRVPGVVFASRKLLRDAEKSLEQVANVATLPGIVGASYAMPDIHWGYGFPIGGVAATDVADGGVVSPGGVGFDISCGVRLLTADVDSDGLASVLPAVMDGLDRAIPRGAGPGGVWHLTGPGQLERILLGGSRYAVGEGHGEERDLTPETGVLGQEHLAHAARAEAFDHAVLQELRPGNRDRGRHPLILVPRGRRPEASRTRGSGSRRRRPTCR